MSRANQWFVLGDGIAREVITADIQRYLGPDALVKPGTGIGEHQGKSGYWITAYRTLTTQMIQDLKMDSQRWREERQPEGRGAYQDSQTHAARQHWGPSNPVDHPTTDSYDRRSAPRASGYATSAPYAAGDGHYTTAPASYGSAQTTYQVAPPSAGPRTAPTYNSGYSQRDQGYPSQQYGSYPAQQSSADPYSRSSTAPTAYATPSATPAPGFYIASDGREYPLPQQSSRSSQPGGYRKH